MRAKSESLNSTTDDSREWLKEFDTAMAQNSEMLRKDGRVITRIRFALDDLKKASKLRRKVEKPDAKLANPGIKKILRPAPASIAPPELLTEQLLAVRWFCSRSRLQHWRTDGKGPRYLKIGGRILYRLTDVQNFETASRVK
ncbi:MAG: hypothetical protein KAX84_02885 [Burkholderiales bacterium]|nr:hypothetical protein [Burkholderiales bacterium]